MHRDNYIIVKDRHPRISEVLNDCIKLCVPTSKDESLASILQKICAKITKVSYTFVDTDTVTFHVNGTQVSADAIAGQGTVTSVALDDIASFADATGSPITESGTLGYTLVNQTANRVFAGPATGSPAIPTFRALVAADIPDLSSVYLTSVPINILQNATGTNSINSANFSQTWAWNSLAAATGLTLTSSSTAATSNSQIVFSSLLSGANANASQTTRAAKFSNSHTGTSSTNIGIHAIANSGTINYAGLFENSIRMELSGNFLTLIGGNPSQITSDSAIIITANNVNNIVADSNGTSINPNIPNITGRFSVSGDSDNDMIYANYANQTVGINTASATRSFEVFTKYLDELVDHTFWAARFTARKYGSTGLNPITNGFGVGHEFAIQNSTNVNKIVGTSEYVYTDVTNGSEDADYILSLIATGTKLEKLRVISTGQLKLTNYGSGTYTGTATYNLGTDASGNIIEVSTSGGGGASASDTFNATSDWTGPSGGYYSFAFAHGLGSDDVSVTIWDETSTPILVFPEITERTNNNTVTLKVPDSPDSRFVGRIIVKA